MLTLKKVKELVNAPVHTKRVPSPKVLLEEGRIFRRKEFEHMLNQASGDRQILAKQLNISPFQLSYVTNSNEGEGLLFYGNTIIPFKDKFDTSLKLYGLMTTKPNEIAKYRERKDA